MIEYIKVQKLRFFISISLILIVSVSSIYAVYIRSEIINTILDTSANFWSVIIYMLLAILLSEGANMFLSINNAQLRKQWDLYLGTKISDQILNKSYNQFHTQEVGNYVSWYTGQLTMVSGNIFQMLFPIIRSAILLVISALTLLYISWKLFVVAVLMLIVVTLVGKLFSEKLASFNRIYNMQSEKFNQVLKEYLGGYDIFKNFSRFPLFKHKVKTAQLEVENVKYNLRKYNAFVALTSTGVKHFFEGIMFVVTTYLILNNELSLGLLMVTPFILSFFLDASATLLTSLIHYKGSLETKAKLEQFKHLKTSQYPSFNDKIQFDKVSFQYDTKTVLNNVNFSFEKNKKYAIIGKSGSGKSTLLKLLLGRLQPTTGKILFDGNQFNNEEDIDFSQKIAYVNQDNYLFDLSIRENITLGEHFSDEEIYKVLKEVQIFDFVEQLEHKLDTKIGNLGANISGGERQRIALARALIRDLDTIILDEATSAVDEATTKEIEKLVLAKNNKTIILISHHLDAEIYNQFDMVYDLEKYNTK